jgi:serine/threonine protein kinase
LVGVCYRDGEKLVNHDDYVAAESDPLRGRLVAGKYRVSERVGQGGMGTVYRAVQTGLNRNVAVKILKRELAFDPDTVARFQREANALSLLAHPNTVRVYDFGQTEDGLLFLVMELLEGELVSAMLNREGVLDVLDAVRFTQQILRALAEAHEHNIVHRDLKPDNILVTRVVGHPDAVVKVLDFGIAKIAAPDRAIDQFETQAGTVFGTPRYMSPEQAQGSALDGRSDLYSVGALLYLMLTGRAPFVDEDAVVVMAKHIREVPDNPRVAAPDRPIPRSLDDVVMRSLAKDPDLRFQHAKEFEAALDACVADILGGNTRTRRPGKLLSASGSIAGALTLVFLGYGGFRMLAHGEPGKDGLTTSPLQLPAAPPSPTPVVTEEEEQVLAEGPGPANVAIRSHPEGATVFRNGQRLGETPLDLLVQPDQDLVRVELRKAGFQPLTAELTARDGERLLQLMPEQPVSPSATASPRNSGRPASRRPSSVSARERGAVPEPSRPQPPVAEPKVPVKGPYERFE